VILASTCTTAGTNGLVTSVASRRLTSVYSLVAPVAFRVSTCDDESRLFDLEDGETATFNAKMIDPEYVLSVGDWFNTGRSYVHYSVTLLEVA